jgi:hypothetical protein
MKLYDTNQTSGVCGLGETDKKIVIKTECSEGLYLVVMREEKGVRRTFWRDDVRYECHPWPNRGQWPVPSDIETGALEGRLSWVENGEFTLFIIMRNQLIVNCFSSSDDFLFELMSILLSDIWIVQTLIFFS